VPFILSYQICPDNFEEVSAEQIKISNTKAGRMVSVLNVVSNEIQFAPHCVAPIQNDTAQILCP